ncbi:MAG: response regulator [Gemmatimonas sp.]
MSDVNTGGDGVPARILHLEDSDLDAELVRERLVASGLGAQVERVHSKEEFLQRIDTQTFDLILADFRVPGFDGLLALELTRERLPDVPFVFLSGAMGEEVAIDALKRGATDYVLKQRLARLPGAIERALAEARERADRKEAQRRLRESAAELIEADRRKDEFIATLAHELRNPLAPIRNGLTILRLANVPAPDDVLGMMDRQLSHLVRLVDDLLDVSRVISGKVVLKREVCTVQSVIEAAVETSRPLIEASSHRLHVSMPDDTVLIDADPTRIAQIISNLLNNSAKYTPEGGRIDVAVVSASDSVSISVRDNGIGIPAEMLPRVFELFTQGGRHLERSQGGLGVGLSLVKRLVDLHGGGIEARSEGPGFGSTFTIRLPRTRERRQSPRITPSTAVAIAPLRVLIVDDNEDAASSMAMMLKLTGNETCVAHDGTSALAMGRDFKPQVVFLDIGMPDMSGYEVARLARAAHTFDGATVVALTGWGSESDQRRALDAGFDFHLTKPVDFSAVTDILMRTAKRLAGRRQ